MHDGEDLYFISGWAIDNNIGGTGNAELAGRVDTASVAGGRIATQHFYCLEDAGHES